MVMDALRARRAGGLFLQALFELYEALIKIWFTWGFIRSKRAHFIPLGFGILFWGSTMYAVGRGTAPLLAWMICGLISAKITATVIKRIFMRTLVQEHRYGPAMLLLQLTVTIAANTFVIGEMIVLGLHFRADDRKIAYCAAACLAVVMVAIMLKRAAFDSDWALCGYTVSLKSAPQAVQAWSIYKGAAMLDPWSAFFLFSQALSRLVLSIGVYRNESTTTSRSQLVNASVDQLTISLIFGAVLQRSWRVFVGPFESLRPYTGFIVEAWGALR